MGQVGPSCSQCNVGIPSSDLHQTRAVTVLKKPYCRDCSEQIAHGGLRGTPRFLRKIQFGTMALGGVRDPLGQHRRPLYLAVAILSLGLMALVFMAATRGWGIRS
jgi:hypothetical protein